MQHFCFFFFLGLLSCLRSLIHPLDLSSPSRTCTCETTVIRFVARLRSCRPCIHSRTVDQPPPFLASHPKYAVMGCQHWPHVEHVAFPYRMRSCRRVKWILHLQYIFIGSETATRTTKKKLALLYTITSFPYNRTYTSWLSYMSFVYFTAFFQCCQTLRQTRQYQFIRKLPLCLKLCLKTWSPPLSYLNLLARPNNSTDCCVKYHQWQVQHVNIPIHVTTHVCTLCSNGMGTWQ